MYSRLAISHSDDEDETHRTPDPSPGGVSPAEDANNQAHVGHHHRAASTPEPSGRKDADDIFGLFDNNDAGEGPKPSAASSSSAQHQKYCQTSSTSPEPDSPAPPVRMTREQQAELPDHDGAQLDRRELLLYALPLYHDSENPLDGLCFLPVSNFLEEKDYSGMTGGIKRRMDELQDKVDTKWQELKTAEPGTFSNKVYKVGHNVANDLTPEQRLTQNIPENVSKVIVFHPRQVPPDAILEKLTAVSSGQSKWTTAKAAMATLMLPVALGIDVLIIPGPSILTWYTSYQIYKNASSAVGSQRLNKYLNNRDECNVRVNYAGDARLDPYWDEVQHSHDGALDEESCEQLVNDIGQPELLEPVLELRKRWLQENMPTTRASFTGGGQEYQALRNGEACHY